MSEEKRPWFMSWCESVGVTFKPSEGPLKYERRHPMPSMKGETHADEETQAAIREARKMEADLLLTSASVATLACPNPEQTSDGAADTESDGPNE